MTTRKNALLLFSKPPIPGLVKTRLTPIKDGIFSPEVAAGLYHCMFFDVVEICCDALADLEKKRGAAGRQSEKDETCLDDPLDTYDIIISTTPAENVVVMEQLFADSGQWPREIKVICDIGKSFDEHYNNSFDQVFALGYDTVLSMGADMPALSRHVIIEGFSRLHNLCGIPGGGMVLSPDQEMGVSIVGWTRDTDMTHSGVFYNTQGYTVLPAYIHKARDRGLPVLMLPAVPDVDTMADLHHNITLVEAIEYCSQFQKDLSVPWRTINALHEMNYDEVRVMPNELRDPREGIDAY